MENTKKEKQTSILIEVVSNGFVVEESFHKWSPELRNQPESPSKKVFNTKKQLNNYINDNL